MAVNSMLMDVREVVRGQDVLCCQYAA
jgi:hypothetical protein